MKTQSFPKLFLSVALCCTLVFAFGLMSGCKGSDGSNGAPGQNAATTGTLSGTVTTKTGGVALAGVLVTTNPVVTGATTTTAADGTYSLALPGGSYVVTYAATDYTSVSANVNIADGIVTPTNVTLAESAGGEPSVALVASGQNVGFGNNFTLTATASSPIAGTTLSYAWTGVASSATNSANANAQTFTAAMGGAPAPSNDPGGFISAFVQDARFGVLPINADTRGTASPSVTVTDGQGGSTTASVSVWSAGIQGAVRQVALGIPVYMNSGSTPSTAGWTWALTPVTGSTATLSFVGTSNRNPWFTPDLAGSYVVTATSGTYVNSMTIFAGKYIGAITGGSYTTKTFSATDPKAGIWFGVGTAPYWTTGATSATYTNWPTVTFNGGCAGCHTGGTIAVDQLDPWAGTAHATFFARGLENITSNSGSCVECHTVGSEGTPGINNGGYDYEAAQAGFVYAKSIGAWSKLTTSYPTVAAVTNIQCENCHGANISAGPGAAGSGHGTAGTGVSTDPSVGNSVASTATGSQAARVSYSADVCGQCHSEGTGHHNYSEWNTGIPNVLMADGVTPQSNAGMAHSNTSVAIRESGCACHTAEGYVKWIPQLMKGDMYYRFGANTFGGILNTLGSPTRVTGVTDAYQAAWTSNEAQPQTCTACHDPHSDANQNQLRVYDTMPLIASGVKNIAGFGKGAVCIVCHNLRGGDQCASAITATALCPNGSAAPNPSFTHEDTELYNNGAPYNSVHDGPQTDVFTGRNAYFMGGSLPMLSKHAAVDDTCVGCHMTLNPQTHLSHGTPAESTHTFYILDNQKATLCANCHSSNVDGDAIVRGTQAGLVNIQNAIATYVAARINANLTSVFILTKGQTVAVPISTFGTGVTATSNGSSVYLTTTGTPSYLGSFSNTTLYSNAGATGLFFWSNTALGTPNKYSKAVWNYGLINNDASFGIHNPSFVSAVIDATIAALSNTSN